MVEQFNLVGDAAKGRLYSVTLAVTNRCMYNCWHCCNAGRAQKDLALADWKRLVGQIKEMSAVMITLTGGEPLLRDDLEEVVRLCGGRACVIVNTTGFGLTPERARRLRDSGVFGIGVSLDSRDAKEHDRLRGAKGAFETALKAIRIAGENGIYPYIVSVATREFLQPERFHPFIRFAGEIGAREVHLLEPSATGRLKGRTEVLLTRAERRRIFDYQKECAQYDSLPILSAFAYVESADAFGCGAGLTHLYIDGSGEVCPCNLVPLSFGNFTREPLADILARMRCHFCKPRTGCVGRLLGKHSPDGRPPQPPSVSEEVCKKHLPKAPVAALLQGPAGGAVTGGT
jgi:MoaA/NifB/PqqE/SkfB family radical SAM enzyme